MRSQQAIPKPTIPSRRENAAEEQWLPLFGKGNASIRSLRTSGAQHMSALELLSQKEKFYLISWFYTFFNWN